MTCNNDNDSTKKEIYKNNLHAYICTIKLTLYIYLRKKRLDFTKQKTLNSQLFSKPTNVKKKNYIFFVISPFLKQTLITSVGCCIH